MTTIKREVDTMKKCRWRIRKRPTKYVPIRTIPPKKKKKKNDFVSKGKSDELNKKGINLEKSSIVQKNILYFIVIILSGILCFCDVRDDGMLFEGCGFKFSGSLVGVLTFVLCVIGIYRNKPKVTLE